MYELRDATSRAEHQQLPRTHHSRRAARRRSEAKTLRRGEGVVEEVQLKQPAFGDVAKSDGKAARVISCRKH